MPESVLSRIEVKMKRLLLILLALLMCSMIIYAVEDENKPQTVTDNPTTLIYPSTWHTPFGIHRGTPLLLNMFLGARTSFNMPEDLAATKHLFDFGKINKDSDDWQLTVYGVNSGNSEIIYNSSMFSLNIYGKEGHGETGEFFHPIGITCNEGGDIYVADTGNNRIVRLFNNGKKLIWLRTIGSKGSEKGKFNNPTYVALDASGRIFVSDTGNSRIQVFGKSGGLLYIIDKDSGISSPAGICVSDSKERYTGYRFDFIYLVDGNNSRVQKMTVDGRLITSCRVNEILKRDVFLTTLEQDYYGNVYVVDRLNSQILKFSPDLDFITAFGKPGTGDYEFQNPAGIAIYKHYGQVFVSDKESAQYFWIGADMLDFKTQISKVRKKKTMEFSFFMTEKGYVTIDIDSGRPDMVLRVCDKIQFEMGKSILRWDIPVEYQPFFNPGTGYKAKITVMATYSSYPHMEKVLNEMVFF